jgi:hypothetical protein
MIKIRQKKISPFLRALIVKNDTNTNVSVLDITQQKIEITDIYKFPDQALG